MGMLYGTYFETADTTNTNIFQSFVPAQETVLRSFRTWLIMYGDPSFTSVSAKIYSDNGGVPGVLLYTSSNAITKTQLFTVDGILSTDDHGARGVYFEFLSYNSTAVEGVPLNSGETYHMVLNFVGATFTVNSHIAWVNDVYDPVYAAAPDVEQLDLAPLTLAFIGSEL